METDLLSFHLHGVLVWASTPALAGIVHREACWAPSWRKNRLGRHWTMNGSSRWPAPMLKRLQQQTWLPVYWACFCLRFWFKEQELWGHGIWRQRNFSYLGRWEAHIYMRSSELIEVRPGIKSNHRKKERTRWVSINPRSVAWVTPSGPLWLHSLLDQPVGHLHAQGCGWSLLPNDRWSPGSQALRPRNGCVGQLLL